MAKKPMARLIAGSGMPSLAATVVLLVFLVDFPSIEFYSRAVSAIFNEGAKNDGS